jgi:hypothetical protein
MFHRAGSLLGIAVALSLVTASARGDEIYKTADGLFSFVMPAEPKQSAEEAGGIKMSFNIHETPTGVFILSIMDLPPEAAQESEDDVQTRLAGGVKKFAASVAGTVLEDKKFTFATKYPAREFKVSASPGGMEGAGRGRIYAAKGKLVQMFVLGEKSWANAADKDTFLGSLKLVE